MLVGGKDPAFSRRDFTIAVIVGTVEEQSAALPDCLDLRTNLSHAIGRHNLQSSFSYFGRPGQGVVGSYSNVTAVRLNGVGGIGRSRSLAGRSLHLGDIGDDAIAIPGILYAVPAIQVTKGLQAGDSVLITGLLALRQDQPIKITSVK